MGGLGSGGHNSKGWRNVESQYWLDASDIKRRGLMQPGYSFQLYWKSSDTRPAPSICVYGGADSIALSYSWRCGDGPWQAHTERVALRHVPRNFGGEESYFLCPKCARCVKRLYCGGIRILCRTCHGLVHASTQERGDGRAIRRVRKLRRRIGADLGVESLIGPKPKGMHYRTFERIVDAISSAEEELNDHMICALARALRI